MLFRPFLHLATACIQKGRRRAPDFVIGDPSNPYLKRWWLIPRNRFLNVYLHRFLRSDDDRALHDHPWAWCSLLLRGRYIEVTKDCDYGFGSRAYTTGSFRFHRPRFAHRLELVKGAPCWTLFITGPKVRAWGFHCPKGWRHWRVFTDASTQGATVGRGCE